MNILFLSLISINDINASGIYNDLLRKFYNEGHTVYIVSPSERRGKGKTSISCIKKVHYLKVWTLNYQKTNFIEKGLSTLLIEYQFKHAIIKYIKNVKFDLVIYPTPPITFANVVRCIKKRDNAFTYLLLKDIFPQNAVDLGMISRNGLMYRYFRTKERQLYKVSDVIGCMSGANVKYLLSHNPGITCKKVEICPNSIEVEELIRYNKDEVNQIRNKYGLSKERFACIYGGNLGKPQDISYIIECLKLMADDTRFQFLIVGSGTEYHKLERFVDEDKPENVILLSHLPQFDYDELVKACDAGLIFLDHRFTIPNYPSRLLSYMSAGIPVLAATDTNTDVGQFIESNSIGVWCESTNPGSFRNALIRLRGMHIDKETVFKVLKSSYDVSVSYQTIIKHLHEDFGK